MPIRFTSGETEKDLDILIFPLPVLFFFIRSIPGPEMAGSFKSSRSLMFTRDCRIPICTYRSPLELGRELTVPFKFMVSTLTPSPIFNFFGEMVFFGPFSFLRLRFLSTLSSFSRSFVRSASSSFPTPEDWASLLIWRMVWSAVSLASRRILWASSLAFRISLSFRSSNRSSFCSRRLFNREISDL